MHPTDLTEPRGSTWHATLGARGLLLVWCCAFGAALAALSPWHAAQAWIPASLRWWMGLAVHWQWPALVMGLTGATFAVMARRHSAWVALAVVMGGWSLHLPAAPTGDATGPALSVATANVNYENRDVRPLLAWLQSPQAPDVIVLQEFTEAYGRALDTAGGQALRDAYPHRAWHPQPDQFGIGVMSRWPIAQQQRVEPIDAWSTQKLRLRIEWRGQPVAVTAVHPMPPIAPVFLGVRDRSLRDEAQRLAEAGIPGVLLGDFNDTPWSSGMQPLAPQLRRASGLAPTWPNAWGWLSVLPLDHVLVTPQWVRVASSVGPDLGSDHRPVVVLLRMAR